MRSVHSSPDMSKMVFKKKEDIVSRRIAGETLLVPIRGKLANMERIFSLDLVAEFVWEKLDGETSLGAIQNDVLDAFDVGRERAETDISEFLDELLKADLVVEVK